MNELCQPPLKPITGFTEYSRNLFFYYLNSGFTLIFYSYTLIDMSPLDLILYFCQIITSKTTPFHVGRISENRFHFNFKATSLITIQWTIHLLTIEANKIFVSIFYYRFILLVCNLESVFELVILHFAYHRKSKCFMQYAKCRMGNRFGLAHVCLTLELGNRLSYHSSDNSLWSW